MNLIDKILKKLNVEAWLPDEDKLTVEQQKSKTIFIIALIADDGRIHRAATKSIDHVKANLYRFPDNRIAYLARRWGKGMKEVESFAVFSTDLGKVYRTKEQAFEALSQKVFSDPH